jgi:O-antigen/teichoic acid export membrane protein
VGGRESALPLFSQKAAMSNVVNRTRLVLKTGSLVFGLSALLLLAAPALFNELLGLATNPALEWSMRMIGITLVALAGNMFSVASRGSEASVRFSARVMQASAFALGVLTLMIPTAQTWFTIGYAAIGFGFSIAYTIALGLGSKADSQQ